MRTTASSRLIFRLNRGHLMADVPSEESIESAAKDLGPGTYTVDVLSANAVGGYTSRSWGRVIMATDGRVGIEREPR